MQEETVTSAAKNAAAKAKTAYPEISDIGKDLQSLKDDVCCLASHIAEESLSGLSDKTSKGYESFVMMGKSVEKKIKEQPVQSLAIAFAGGLLANLLFFRK